MSQTPPEPEFPPLPPEPYWDDHEPELFWHDRAPEPIAPAPSYGPPTLAAARSTLRAVFGFDEFRSLQERIVGNVLARRDTLVVMPTGSGKSLCYQLPALLFPGLTVVVSPLISLMQDQVDQLRELGVPAAALNSALDYDATAYTIAQIRSGALKLLYAAPETLLRPETMALLEQSRVDCLTIDEAHCISEWGHDFRPEYRQLVDLRARLPEAVCVAVTATATDHVRRDIAASLAIAEVDEFVASFDRENLYLAVATRTSGLSQTLAFLRARRGESGIIYCRTRRQVDSLVEQLAKRNWPVLPYHAGLEDDARRDHQRKFVRDEVQIMVATIAFGMGIDKSNVRFILHYDLPQSLEAYYQQIGRAGRDGLPSDCLLLYSYGDARSNAFFHENKTETLQKSAELRQRALLDYVNTRHCRRRPLLAYFDEAYGAESCGMCDNCRGEQQELVDITVPAQKFLSCVRRTGELFGASHIIDVLRGSRSQRLIERGHDRLSTYNIGAEFTKDAWQNLANQFLQLGLLRRDTQHGSLKLTGKGWDVLRGEPVRGTLPAATPSAPRVKQAGAADQAEADQDLFEQLRQKRLELARAQRIAPYMVFSDRTLKEMAASLPQTRGDFAHLHGVGDVKLEKYADTFLDVIQGYLRQEKPEG